MVIKEISKTHFVTRSGTIMWKRETKNVKILAIYYHYDGKGHLSYTCCILKHLTNNEKNIETHFAYEDGDSDYGHMDTTLLNIIIFFDKQNGIIDNLIGYESVKKNLILLFMLWCIHPKAYSLGQRLSPNHTQGQIHGPHAPKDSSPSKAQ